MRKVLSGWVLVMGLVAGGLAGMTVGNGEVAKAAVGPLERMTVPAAAFHPTTNGQSFLNDGYQISGQSNYLAALSFPYEKVRIRRVIVRFYDNVDPSHLCVSLIKGQPGVGYGELLGSVCSPSDASTTDPDTAIFRVNRPMTGWYGGYLYLNFDTLHSYLKLYGVTIEYYEVL